MRQFRPVVLVSIRRYRDLSGVVEMIAGSSAAFVQLCDELHITLSLSLSLSLTHTHTHKRGSGFLVGCGHHPNTTPKGLSSRFLVMSLIISHSTVKNNILKPHVTEAEDLSNESPCREMYWPHQHQWLFKLYDILYLLDCLRTSEVHFVSAHVHKRRLVLSMLDCIIWPYELSLTRRTVHFCT